MKQKQTNILPFSHLGGSFAFTLAEVLITLAVIGIVAALTIPTLVNAYQEIALVSALKKNYSIFSQAVLKWQSDNSCTEDIKDCMSSYAGWDCENGFNDAFKDEIKIVARGNRSETAGLDWLPDDTTLFDGSQAAIGQFAVSKNASHSDAVCHFLLTDGATFSLSFNDFGNKYGLIAVDVNGKKRPNRIGKDTFFIGLIGKGLTPYFGYEYGGYEGGQCNSYNNSSCNPNDGLSPTAYVLTHDKLPNTKALFGN